MKKKLSLFLLILSLLTGCSRGKNPASTVKDEVAKDQPPTTETSPTIDNTEQLKQTQSAREQLKDDYAQMETITTIAFSAVTIHTIGDVIDTTELGIEGIVLSTEPYIYQAAETDYSPYTNVRVLVNRVIMGDDTLVGSEIEVYQAGGVISKKELGYNQNNPDMSPSELNEKVLVNFDGVQNSLPSDQVVFFLVKTPGNLMALEKDVYQIMGNYKTRFDKNLENGHYQRATSSDGQDLDDSISDQELSILNNELNKLIEED